MSNNLFFGNVSQEFKTYDSAPVFGDPAYASPGGNTIDSYKIAEGSPAIGAGMIFTEPVFSNAGYGIFSHIDKVPEFDLYGNPVDLANSIPSIGAFNADPISGGSGIINEKLSTMFNIYPNPVRDKINISLKRMIQGETEFVISDLTGRIMQKFDMEVFSEDMNISIELKQDLVNGIYVLHVMNGGSTDSQIFVLAR